MLRPFISSQPTITLKSVSMLSGHDLPGGCWLRRAALLRSGPDVDPGLRADSPRTAIAPGGSMIRLENCSKVYKNSVVALSDVSCDIQKGEFVFLVGPSGSGKS